MTKNLRWLWVFSATLLAMSLAGGCRRRPPVSDARVTEREYNELLRLAARATGCPAEQLTGGRVAGPPVTFTVTGCRMPVEYYQECSRRRCRWREVTVLNVVAAPILQCAPEMIQQVPTQVPAQRFASGCGRTVSFAMSCTAGGCAWGQSGPVQAQGQGQGQAPYAQGQPQPQPQPQTNGGPSSGEPSATLQAQVAAQRDVVLSCIEDTSITLRLRWTADGQVLLQLPPEMSGSAAEGCIQAALSQLQVSAGAEGEVIVPVQ